MFTRRRIPLGILRWRHTPLTTRIHLETCHEWAERLTRNASDLGYTGFAWVRASPNGCESSGREIHDLLPLHDLFCFRTFRRAEDFQRFFAPGGCPPDCLRQHEAPSWPLRPSQQLKLIAPETTRLSPPNAPTKITKSMKSKAEPENSDFALCSVSVYFNLRLQAMRNTLSSNLAQSYML